MEIKDKSLGIITFCLILNMKTVKRVCVANNWLAKITFEICGTCQSKKNA